MFPTIQIGPAALQLPAFLIVIGFWIGWTQIEKTSDLFEIPGSLMFRLIFAATISGILGARLAYVLRYLDAFIESPISIISLNLQLLDGQAGVLVGCLLLLILGQKNGLTFWRTLDVLSVGAGIFMVGLALSNLASGDAYGSPTQVPWGIWLWGAKRHPVQVYDFLLALGILGVIYPTWRFARWVRLEEQRSGAIFLVFLALSSAARLFTEAFRGDSLFLPGGIRAVQVFAFVLLAGCLILLRSRFTAPK